MHSSNAQVEPLPLVPPTVITGHVSATPRRAKTALTRSSPIAIALGCSVSRYASHSLSVEACLTDGATKRRAAGARSASARGKRLALQQGQQLGQIVLELTAIDDHVDGAFFEQKFGALKTLGKLFAHSLLDHSRAREPNQGSRFGENDVAD